jgi:hypothetical protein
LDAALKEAELEAELDAAPKEIELFAHDDVELDLDNNNNNRDDDTPSRKERRAVLKATLQRMRQSRSGRPRQSLPIAASTDKTDQALASGYGGGAGPVPTPELDAALKEAAAEAKTAETVTDPQDKITPATNAAHEDDDDQKQKKSPMKSPPPKAKASKPQTERAKKAERTRDMKYRSRVFTNKPHAEPWAYTVKGMADTLQ